MKVPALVMSPSGLSPWKNFTNPKSSSLTKSWSSCCRSSMTLAGFRSRWMIPSACASRSERRVLLHRLRERPTVEVLHGDEEDAVLGAPVVVKGDGVGMGQLGGDRRLEEETLVEIGIAVVAGAEDLERHHAVERRLQRLVHAAHAALADRLDDAVAVVDGAPEEGVGVGGRRRLRRGRDRGHAGQFRLDHHSTEGQTSGLSICRQIVVICGAGMSMRNKVEELRRRRAEALRMGGEERLRRQRERGKLDARALLELLLDPGRIVEIGH